MRPLLFSILIALGMTSAAGLAHAQDATSQSDAVGKQSATGERRILYYRNPMGLPDTSQTPKKDQMGMDYLPVYADEGGQDDPPGTVRISPGRLQTLGVRTEAALMRPYAARSIRATGSLEFDERHLAAVTTKVSGWVEHLAVSATGDSVKRGQVLAEIYSPDLVASENEYLVAAQLDKSIIGASDQRLRALDIPVGEIERLRRTGKVARRIAVLAPADGIVVEKPAQEGMRVEAGEPLYKTADLSTVWLIAQVQEQDLGLIQQGEQVSATFVAYPGRSFTGTVDFIYPTLSSETRTGQVRIIMPNPDGALRISMYANVEIKGAIGNQSVLAVPSSAVLDSGTRQVVLVAVGQGKFQPRAVHLGIRGDDWAQILSGVKEGERVVVGANFLIDAESNLRAALQGFTDGAKSSSDQSKPAQQDVAQ
ncbi:efflux RND transporter periplasmic adaptor subunit [Dongia soli]|uniref:Efflux RND transporter periplasmic adaptor subunit n=1 Tax=Dongia soli TaxID=600628 RepID=A0ABU5EI43_9PROT|nr:efflux RND transporter periplasmic adaptor subunit [Dongia soli]MDY0885878.1 efflux RND transporter periplasmic adaptor subunit [Dongia soli]